MPEILCPFPAGGRHGRGEGEDIWTNRLSKKYIIAFLTNILAF